MQHAVKHARPLVALLLLIAGCPALAGSPLVVNLMPVAVQRGQTVDATFYGDRLADARGVLFHTPGISAGEITDAEQKKVRTTLTVAADAPLGEHQLRLVTKTGVSEMVTIRVLDRPIVKERRDEPRKKNNKRFVQSTSLQDPQVIELGTTIVGRTESEDIDYFAVEVAKGQRVSLQVDGVRLGRGFTDSHLAVLGPKGQEVAECDDTPLLGQDPYLSFTAEQAGRYVIVLRDSGYEGSNNNWYLLHVGSFPRPAVTFPLGGQPGETVTLRFIGDLSGAFTQQVTLPNEVDNDFKVLPVLDGKAAPSGHPFRVNDLPNVMEDPTVANNRMSEVADGKAKAYDAPVAFNGVIDSPGDPYDYYVLRLRKDQRIDIRCFANTMGSPLDSVINLFSAKDNKHLLGNDDQGGPDSQLTFKAPHDGAYYLRVRDHLGRGGPAFVYRIEVTRPTPGLSTAITRYDRNRPQTRQAIAVPKGNRMAALVSVRRQNTPGDLQPLIAGLPSGVSFRGLSPAEQASVMPVVFEATADAPIDSALVNIQALWQPKDDSSGSAKPIGAFRQSTPLVMANPNRTEYYRSTLKSQAVVVTEQAQASIQVAQPKAPIVYGGRMQLKVKVNRAQGHEGTVQMYPLYRPPGIGATGRVDVKKGKTEGVFNIDANASVPVRTWPMVIIALVPQPGGGVWVSSQVFDLKVAEPFVGGSIAKSKCVQGGSTSITVNLEHKRDWQGEGELKLLGLPAHAEAKPIKIKPGQQKAVFNVKTADTTPRGTHKSLMCELVIQVDGEPVIHRFGQGGRLRIDRAKGGE